MNGFPIRRCAVVDSRSRFLALEVRPVRTYEAQVRLSSDASAGRCVRQTDMSRISNLLGMVAGNDFGQIFITDSNKVRMSGIVDGLTADRAYFEAVGGEFREI